MKDDADDKHDGLAFLSGSRVREKEGVGAVNGASVSHSSFLLGARSAAELFSTRRFTSPSVGTVSSIQELSCADILRRLLRYPEILREPRTAKAGLVGLSLALIASCEPTR